MWVCVCVCWGAEFVHHGKWSRRGDAFIITAPWIFHWHWLVCVCVYKRKRKTGSYNRGKQHLLHHRKSFPTDFLDIFFFFLITLLQTQLDEIEQITHLDPCIESHIHTHPTNRRRHSFNILNFFLKCQVQVSRSEMRETLASCQPKHHQTKPSWLPVVDHTCFTGPWVGSIKVWKAFKNVTASSHLSCEFSHHSHNPVNLVIRESDRVTSWWLSAATQGNIWRRGERSFSFYFAGVCCLKFKAAHSKQHKN